MKAAESFSVLPSENASSRVSSFYYYYHYTYLMASFHDNLGTPVPEGKTSLDLNEARDDGVLGWQWHQLDHTETIRTSLQTDNHNNTSTLNFY